MQGARVESPAGAFAMANVPDVVLGVHLEKPESRLQRCSFLWDGIPGALPQASSEAAP